VDFSETQNNIYFFLEFCDSGDLEKYLKKRGKVAEAEALILFKQIVDGIAYLYDKNIFHRDLKPENILIHQNVPKIADFGFSKVIEEDKRDTLNQGTAVGTPFYMAPQILEGD
jgi:serine/threonine protein kinase